MVQQLQLRPNLNRFGLLIGAFFFWLSALFCSVSAADLLPIPEVAYVTDTAHLLTAEQKRSLEAKLAGFEEKYGSQIAVIIVPSTNGEPIEDYAHRVGDNWKLGRKDVGDGLLLIVAVNDHRIRIDVMRALEGAIPDVAASRIITDVMAPNFRQNNYYQGISQALDKVFTLIEDAKLPAPQKKRSEANILYDPAEALWDEPWVAVLFIGFVITMMLRELMGRKSAPLAGLAVGGLAAFIMQSLFAGIVIALIVVVIAMCIPTAVLEAGARRTAKMYGTDRRYRGKRGGGDDGFGGFGGFGDMGDIFDSIFGGFGGGFGGGRSANPNAPRRGEDIRANVVLDFMEACKGKTVKLRINRAEKCPDCHGTGAAAGSSPKTCPDCHGTGTVRITQRTPFGNIAQTTTCSRCGGKGQIIDNPCHTCNGQGRVKKVSEKEINVPAGIDDGQTLRVGGEGNCGINGGPNGDLHINITVRPDPIFERDGYDVWTEIPLTYAQATLGDEITVPTVDGKVKYTVPEGTQTGTVFRLRGKGIKKVNRNDHGDHYVRVTVEVPRNLTKEQKEKLRDYEKSLGEKNYAKRKTFFDKLKDKFK